MLQSSLCHGCGQPPAACQTLTWHREVVQSRHSGKHMAVLAAGLRRCRQLLSSPSVDRGTTQAGGWQKAPCRGAFLCLSSGG